MAGREAGGRVGAVARAAASRWEWCALAVLGVWSVGPLVVLVAAVLHHGGHVTGADSLYPSDQFQYMAWIRDAGEHGLIANRLDTRASAHVFVHPLFLVSGGLWRAGLSLPLSFLLWKPVGVVVLFGGFLTYVRRWLAPSRAASASALVMALFFAAPAVALGDWAGLLHGTQLLKMGLATWELFPAMHTWGYPGTAVALGLLALALTQVELAIRPGPPGRRSRRSYLATSSAAALFVSWVHPWQGATLLVLLGGLAASRRFERRTWPLAFPALASLLPLAYYYVLEHADRAWIVAQSQNGTPWRPVWTIAAALAPMLPFAALGWHSDAKDDGEFLLRLWPVACLVSYFASTSFAFHALEGMSLPLAVLAVRGWRRVGALNRGAAGRRWPGLVAALAVAALCAPGALYECLQFRTAYDSHQSPYVLTSPERQALSFLAAHDARAPVVSEWYLGMTVPAYTDHASWLAHAVWTEDFYRRRALIGALIRGRVPPAASARILARSGAGYLLIRCADRADGTTLRAAGVRVVRRFGCVEIWRIASRIPAGRTVARGRTP